MAKTERVLCTNISLEECRHVEKVLREHNISYFEKWKTHTGLFKSPDNPKRAKCDIYIHMDSFQKAKEALGISEENA